MKYGAQNMISISCFFFFFVVTMDKIRNSILLRGKLSKSKKYSFFKHTLNLQHHIQPQTKCTKTAVSRFFTKKRRCDHYYVFGTCSPWVVGWSCILEELPIGLRSGDSQFVSAVKAIKTFF